MSALHIPEKCGVLLIEDATLFPHGGMPLFIFEDRYRQMLEESLQGDCLFCVGRRLGDAAPGEPPKAAPVGTIGLVRASREQEDGTSQLLLHGVIRVRFTDWHDEKPYPYASIEPVLTETLPPDKEAAGMATLTDAVEDATEGLPEEVRHSVLALLARAESAALLTDIVAQQFVHLPDTRQAILEESSIAARISMICAYLDQITKA
ncbi:MAG: LON peptidase substrate-binding domain-containing protein [Luteolibacter sp.]